MKNIVLVAALSFLSIAVTSCKTDEKVDTTKEQSDNIQVIVELKVQNNDIIQLFWAADAPDAYNGDNSISYNIYGSPNLQTITFDLPKNAKPKNLRLDIGGRNPNQAPISIKNISVKYKDASIDGDNGKYEKMWNTNACMKYNFETIEYNLTNDNGTFDPIMNGNEQFKKDLAKLIKKRPAEEGK